MKYALIAVLLIAGCQKQGHNRAVYVRDASHHCKVTLRLEPTFNKGGWDYTEEKPASKKISTRGMTFYSCDGDVRFYIGDDEEQP